MIVPAAVRLFLAMALSLVSLCASANPAATPLPAFPGAEGFGAYARGGRGGDVYHVTTLEDGGPGSLRHGVQAASGPRTIVFEVAGYIDLESSLAIDRPYLTLAGQTAPGEGITLRFFGTSVRKTHDVVIRYLRFRPGDVCAPAGYESDAFAIAGCTDTIVDHVSASWSIDETLSVTRFDRVTLQWCFIAESLNESFHHKGRHGYGSLLSYTDEGGVTVHHCLYAHHTSRSPRPGGTDGRPGVRLDFTNNVIYDWGSRAGYSAKPRPAVRMNYVGNYLLAGPSTHPGAASQAFIGDSATLRIHQAGNVIDADRDGIADQDASGWSMFTGTYTREAEPFPWPALETESATSALARVLLLGGASRARDAVDRRIARQVAGGTGRIIDTQTEVGAWRPLRGGVAPRDSDRDGMPDIWENAHGLDPHDPADRNGDRDNDGYTNLEEYLNGIVGHAQ